MEQKIIWLIIIIINILIYFMNNNLEDIKKFSISQLKEIIKSANLSFNDCIEKTDL